MFDQLILSQSVMYGNADFFIEVFIVFYHPFELFINALSHVAHQLKVSPLSSDVIKHYPPSYFSIPVAFRHGGIRFFQPPISIGELGFAYARLTFQLQDPKWTYQV